MGALIRGARGNQMWVKGCVIIMLKYQNNIVILNLMTEIRMCWFLTHRASHLQGWVGHSCFMYTISIKFKKALIYLTIFNILGWPCIVVVFRVRFSRDWNIYKYFLWQKNLTVYRITWRLRLWIWLNVLVQIISLHRRQFVQKWWNICHADKMLKWKKKTFISW